MASRRLRLGVNIDHVATIRNARGGPHPDPVRAARLAAAAGADGITAHLREDRRHISDGDIQRLMAEIDLRHRPHAACLVPERREEKTTENGLDVAGANFDIKAYIAELSKAGIRVSLFIDPDIKQLEAAHEAGAPVVELHTGAYCEAAAGSSGDAELERIVRAAARAAELGVECHAGHGLSFGTVGPIAAIGTIAELNIGHFLIGEAIFGGLESAITRMRALMDNSRAAANGARSA